MFWPIAAIAVLLGAELWGAKSIRTHLPPPYGDAVVAPDRCRADRRCLPSDRWIDPPLLLARLSAPADAAAKRRR